MLCTALPVQAELLQRDGHRAAAGPAHPRAAGLHRRPVRRARARAGSASSPTPSRRGGSSTRASWRWCSASRSRGSSAAGSTTSSPSAPPSTSTASSTEVDRLGVRDMELVNKFDNALRRGGRGLRHDRCRRQQRQQARDRQVLGDADLRGPGEHDKRAVDRARRARQRRAHRPGLSACSPPARADLPPSAALQPGAG